MARAALLTQVKLTIKAIGHGVITAPLAYHRPGSSQEITLHLQTMHRVIKGLN